MKKALFLLVCLSIIVLVSCTSIPKRFGVIFLYSEDSAQDTQDIYRIPDNTQDTIEQLTFTTRDTTVDYAMVSPKGDSIIFGPYSFQSISVLDLNTQQAKDVTDKFDKYIPAHPAAWSPDQKQFAIIGGKEGYLGVMDIESGKDEYFDLPILGSSPLAGSVSWLPDGKKLVFSRITSMDQPEVHLATFLYDLSERQLMQLTDYDEDCNNPKLSPTGTQIVVTCKPFDYYAPPPNLYVINLSDPSQRYAISDAHSCNFPAWSPDGKQIVYVCIQENGFGIFVSNSDGSERRQIAIENLDKFSFLEFPIWSPDGKQIVYIAGDDEQHANIYSVNMDGSNNRPLTSRPGEYSVLSVYPLP